MDETRRGLLSVFTPIPIKSVFENYGFLITARRVFNTVVSRLGKLVVNDRVAGGCTECPRQQAGAALNARELDMAVRAVTTGIQSSIFQEGRIGFVVYTGALVI